MNPTTILIWLALGVVGAFAVLVPRVGLMARTREWRRAVEREQVENALKYLLDAAQSGLPASGATLERALRIRASERQALLAKMLKQGFVSGSDDALVLTPDGERWALQILRAHRLWERYLADEARLPLKQVHAEAHRREHGMSAQAIEDLDDALGRPALDPHGDHIPDPTGRPRLAGPVTPLAGWPTGVPGRVAHLEDEPPVVYAQLLALGLRLGQVLRVLESSPDRIVVSDGQSEFRLAPAVAANVALAPLPAAVRDFVGAERLSQLPTGERAKIAFLDDSCQGFTRRRFLDLGLTPGTEIRAELANAFREPRAYRVRGTLIALRRDQAEMVWVRPWTGDGERRVS
jgi:DtxR family Mn-dependent transcriptional regulator